MEARTQAIGLLQAARVEPMASLGEVDVEEEALGVGEGNVFLFAKLDKIREQTKVGGGGGFEELGGGET